MGIVSVKLQKELVRSTAPAEPSQLHPAWSAFIRFCRELRHGEVERLTIQDGVPILAVTTRKKVKFVS